MIREAKQKPYNGSDPQQIKSRKLDQELSYESDLNAIKEILNLKSGRRLIWKWLHFCRLYESSFSPSGSQTYYNEGMRNVGLMMLTDITAADPDSFLLMMKENQRENV